MRLWTAGINWVDLLILLFLMIGVSRGRKRGMSEELLDLLKWLCIVVGAAYLYLPVGVALSENSVFGLLSCYLMVYLMILLVIRIIFSFFRHQIGQKLVSSDLFGDGEYYLGMASGFVRYFCIVLVFMALLNARYYSSEDISAEASFQQNYFGTIRFPTLCSLQQQVFGDSMIGHGIHDFVPMLLIQPTSPLDKGLQQASIIRAREQTVNEILDNR